MDYPGYLITLQTWVTRVAALTGSVTLVTPVWGFWRLDKQRRAHRSGKLANVLRFPFMLIMTVLFVAAGVLLWRPVPLTLAAAWRAMTLVVGTLLYFPGIALYLWGFITLGEYFGLSSGFGATLYAGHRLIQSGPYRYVRHPMYLGVILAALGALLIFLTWAMVAFTPISFGIILRARREEALLEGAFGEQWQKYKHEVPGWIPRLYAARDE